MKKYTYGILVAAMLSVVMGGIYNAHAEPSSNFTVTVNPSISVSLSSSDLVISKLTPGTAADSNTITINVSTNSPNGYTLNASVGNNSRFETRNLVHQNVDILNKFTSVDVGSNIAENTNLEDNTWAYSYLDESLNSGTNTTWSNYSGLPLYSDTTNIATIKDTTNSAEDTVKFKIAAKASVDQLAGEYNNVINFTAVAAPLPSYEAQLDTGQNINIKMKALARNTDFTIVSPYDTDTAITTIAKATSLPTGFTPTEANTISKATSPFPVYIFFDYTTGTMYYYTEADDIITNSDLACMFCNYMSLTNIDSLADWSTSSVTNMSWMFTGASSLANIDALNNWDTSKVTNMSSMFSSAGSNSATFILDLSSWDTSSVTNMSDMFRDAGYTATTWSVTIPKTNKGSTPITNTATEFYGSTNSTYAGPPSGKTFTLAN